MDIEKNRKFAFTLAEVLITLGIIGVVAAMTMPVLIQSYRKTVVETRLKKFYSVINQAITLSEVDNGNREWWYQDLTGGQFDDEGNYIEGSSEAEKWFKKYLAPYLNITEMKISKSGLYVYFPDGSALSVPSSNTRDWYFFVTGDKCIKKPVRGVCEFGFNYYPDAVKSSKEDYNKEAWKYSTRNFEPWVWNWDGTKEHLYKNCSGELTQPNTPGIFCTRLIMLNGWKIPDDYPIKF